MSGDGTKIGKRMNVTVFTFTTIGEEFCTGYQGNYLVALEKIPEKQSHISKALPSLIYEIGNLKSVTVCGQTIALDFYLGGDMKFLNVVMSIRTFNAKVLLSLV